MSMTTLDWVIVGFAAFTALLGYRRGLVRTLFSLVGLTVGAAVGARLASHLLADTAASHYAALVGLGGAIAGAFVFRMLATVVGRGFRFGLRLAPPLGTLDSLGGLAVGALWGLVLAWVAAAVVTQVPAHPKWKQEARQSKVLHRLNEIAPPHDLLRLRASLVAKI